MTMTAAAVTVLIEAAAALTAKSAAVTERVAAVYRRGRWLVSNVSDVRIMWNITASRTTTGGLYDNPLTFCINGSSISLRNCRSMSALLGSTLPKISTKLSFTLG
jgi:hypothetical protein